MEAGRISGQPCEVKVSEEEIARSLEGNWQEDLLFLVKQEQDGYEFCQRQIAECDERLRQYLKQRKDRSAGASLPGEKRRERLRKKKENKSRFDLRAELFRMTGTDLTRIDGIDVRTAATVISEAGWDMSKWWTEDHFVSWLRLCPDNRVSGDKVIGKRRLPTNNPLTVALKMAASSLRQSNSYLGAQFRRLRTRLVDRPSDSLSADSSFHIGVGPADRARAFGVSTNVFQALSGNLKNAIPTPLCAVQGIQS